MDQPTTDSVNPDTGEIVDASLLGPLNASAQLDQLAAALAKAQSKITVAERDRENPYFNSKYATLASIQDACRGPLAEHGLAVIQRPGGDGQVVTISTLLVHTSGQWIESILTLRPVKTDPQGVGSAITYGRRYALAAMVGVAVADDDGNQASDPTRSPASATRPAAGPVRPAASATRPAAGEMPAVADDPGESSGITPVQVTEVHRELWRLGVPIADRARVHRAIEQALSWAPDDCASIKELTAEEATTLLARLKAATSLADLGARAAGGRQASPAAPTSASPAPARQAVKLTDAQLRAIRALARSKGMSPEAVEAFTRERYQVAPEGLTIDQASAVIRDLQHV